MSILKKAITGFTLLAFSAGAARASDYATAKLAEKTTEVSILVETTVPKENRSGLEAVLKGMMPTASVSMRLDYKTGKLVPDVKEATDKDLGPFDAIHGETL